MCLHVLLSHIARINFVFWYCSNDYKSQIKSIQFTTKLLYNNTLQCYFKQYKLCQFVAWQFLYEICILGVCLCVFFFHSKWIQYSLVLFVIYITQRTPSSNRVRCKEKILIWMCKWSGTTKHSNFTKQLNLVNKILSTSIITLSLSWRRHLPVPNSVSWYAIHMWIPHNMILYSSQYLLPKRRKEKNLATKYDVINRPPCSVY